MSPSPTSQGPVMGQSAPTGRDYGNAFVTLLHGAKILYAGLLGTIIVGVKTSEFLVAHSKRENEELEVKIDKARDTYEHGKAVAAGDSCLYQKQLAVKTKEVAALKSLMSKAPVSRETSHKAPHSKTASHSSSLRSAQSATASKTRQLSYAEQQQRLGQEEGAAWEQFIHYDGLREHNRPGFGKVVVVKGIITSSATVATYKELVIHASFFSKEGELQGEENQVIQQLIPPGREVFIKRVFKSPIHNPVVDFKITEANYLLPHL